MRTFIQKKTTNDEMLLVPDTNETGFFFWFINLYIFSNEHYLCCIDCVTARLKVHLYKQLMLCAYIFWNTCISYLQYYPKQRSNRCAQVLFFFRHVTWQRHSCKCRLIIRRPYNSLQIFTALIKLVQLQKPNSRNWRHQVKNNARTNPEKVKQIYDKRLYLQIEEHTGHTYT